MIQDFDPSNKEHVKWLKKVLESKVEDKVAILKKNPMNKEFPPFDLIQIIFGLSMKYTQAVFNRTAVFLD
jgi:hypothetical protein